MAACEPIALELMGVVLDEAWRCVPQGQQTERIYSKMAGQLIRAAEHGARNPKKLKEIAQGADTPVDPLDFLAGIAKQVVAEVAGDDALQGEGKQQVRHGPKRS